MIQLIIFYQRKENKYLAIKFEIEFDLNVIQR